MLLARARVCERVPACACARAPVCESGRVCVCACVHARVGARAGACVRVCARGSPVGTCRSADVQMLAAGYECVMHARMECMH
eukprot:14058756-Alexandrium_andersonii.AAC.1